MDESTKKIVKKMGGILLDIGCGANKNEGYVGMDVRPLPGVDIVHNLEKFPWPLEDESCILVHASHVLEHVNPGSPDPKLVGLINLLLDKKVIKKSDVSKYIGEYEVFGNFMRLMDEVWRVLKIGGKFHFVVPYAGSNGFWQDPTHINPISEATLFYFDPYHASGLWNFYRPKPWKIEVNTWQSNGFLEVLLKKVEVPELPEDKKK